MFDIFFHIILFIFSIELEHTLVYQFISWIEVVHPLKTSNKRTDIALPIYFFNWCRASIKTSNKKHTCKFKIYKISYSKSQSRASYDVKN